MSNQVSEGVNKELLKAGTGEKVVVGNSIKVNCIGSLGGDSPKKFWSTSDPGQKPFTFNVGLGQVIKGWDEGCLTMCVGERAKFIIASHKGYGRDGFPAWNIPPNAELVFEIEIISIEK